MNAVWTICAGALTYVACVSLYQANARRTAVAMLRTSSSARTTTFVCAWLALMVALLMFSLPQGFERGVTIWIGAVSLAGFTALLVAALAPDWQIKSAIAVLASAVSTAAILALSGAAT